MDNFQEENKIDFSTPTLSKEQINRHLQRAYQDPEEPDPEISYYNNNRSIIRRNIDKGVIDLQILMYGDILTDFINDGFDLEQYTLLTQQYCLENGIDYEKYKTERQKIIDEIAGNAPSTPAKNTSIVQEEEKPNELSDNIQDSTQINFSEPSLSLEQVDQYLQRTYQDPEEPDPEISYYNNNRSTIRRNIERGIIDPQILRFGDILTNFINDGFDLKYYESFLPEYCSVQGIDFEKYMADRQQVIDELSVKETKNISSTPIHQTPEIEEYEEPYENDNDVEEPFEYDDDSEYEDFLQEAAQTADLHPATKQNWLSKMKSWIKENLVNPMQKYFNKDER